MLPYGTFLCYFSPLDAVTLSFNGSQHLEVTSPEFLHTQSEDISFRFKTTRPVALFFTTWTPRSDDRVEIALQSGSVRMTIKLGEKEKVGRCQCEQM